MPRKITPFRTRRNSGRACNDPVVGAILSGWRYDISGVSPAMRVDYEDHLNGCAHCRRKQRIHRTVDVLLLCATTLSFGAFVLAALVIHRLEALMRTGSVKLHWLPSTIQMHIPDSLQISLQAFAVAGVVVSMLLWVLVAIATPIPAIVTGYVRRKVSLKHAA